MAEDELAASGISLTADHQMVLQQSSEQEEADAAFDTVADGGEPAEDAEADRRAEILRNEFLSAVRQQAEKAEGEGIRAAASGGGSSTAADGTASSASTSSIGAAATAAEHR